MYLSLYVTKAHVTLLSAWEQTWPLVKFRKRHIHSLFTRGVVIELFFALRAAVSELQADFQIYHI